MADVTPKEFFEARNASVVAAAGCGKTELICKAVACSTKLQLVLTHTNAGVQAIKDRFKKLGISNRLYQVETIAGWCLKFTTAYPQLSETPLTEIMPDFPSVYDGMLRFLQTDSGQSIIKASYQSAYIDEYQDCTYKQHTVAVSLATIMPVRIVGDPLQAIFNFGDKRDRLANWESEVTTSFPILGELTHPWRWESSSPELGEWLTRARVELNKTNSIKLSSLPRSVDWYQWTSKKKGSEMTDKQTMAMHVIAKYWSSNLAICKQPQQVTYLSRRTGGKFQPLEEIYSKTMENLVAAIVATSGPRKILAILNLFDECCTKGDVSKEFRTIFKKVAAGSSDFNRITKNVELIPICQNAVRGGITEVLELIDKMQGFRSVKVYRREMFRECIQLLRQHREAPNEPIEKLVWKRQHQRSLFGRKTAKNQISRTLIVKGLEFDTCSVLDPHNLSVNDFYVAITRPRKKLIIVHDNERINFN